jgi:hypothetical protein
MTKPALPNYWHLFNLQESPYFQDTLGEGGARFPLSLFVGRSQEQTRLLAGIGGAASSRQGIGGTPRNSSKPELSSTGIGRQMMFFRSIRTTRLSACWAAYSAVSTTRS